MARTQELTAFIDSKDGDKEVPRLAESFNVMCALPRATSKEIVTDAKYGTNPSTALNKHRTFGKSKIIDEDELIIRDLK